MAMSPRLLRPRAAGGFTPKNISGLEAWWDFSDAATITLNAATVSEVKDKSGFSRHIVQPTASQQPQFTASARNGRSAIFLQPGGNINISGFSVAQPTTWFVVFQAPTTGTGAWVLFDGLAARQGLYGNSSTELRMLGGLTPVIGSVAQSVWYVAVLTFNGASSTHRISTTTATTANPGTNSISSPVIGSAPGTRGNIGEIGIYSKVLSATEATTIARYLSNRWNIAIT